MSLRGFKKRNIYEIRTSKLEEWKQGEGIEIDANITFSGNEISVDTINEATAGNGVDVDGLTIKDGNIIKSTSPLTMTINNFPITFTGNSSSSGQISMPNGSTILRVNEIRSNGTSTDVYNTTFNTSGISLQNNTNFNLASVNSEIRSPDTMTLRANGGSSAIQLVGSVVSTLGGTIYVGLLDNPSGSDIQFNKPIDLNSNELLNASLSICSAKDASTQAITTGNTDAVAFDEEEFDTDGYHDTSTNNSRFTAPDTGYYSVYWSLKMSASSGSSDAVVFVAVNGNITSSDKKYALAVGRSQGTNTHYYNGSAIISLSSGDYVELYVSASGATFTIGDTNEEYKTRFMIHQLRC